MTWGMDRGKIPLRIPIVDYLKHPSQRSKAYKNTQQQFRAKARPKDSVPVIKKTSGRASCWQPPKAVLCMRSFYRGDWQRISRASKQDVEVCPGCGAVVGVRDLVAFYRILPEEWGREKWYSHTCFGVDVRRPWDREDNVGVLCVLCYDEERQIW